MYPDANSRSAQLSRRARQVLPGGNSRSTIDLEPYPLYVAHGEGSVVVDVDGNRLVDFNNNYTSLIHGHGFRPVIDAVNRQIELGTAFAFGTEQEIAHAERLCARVAGFDKVRFMNSGSEAVMNALKAARAFTGRAKIAKCEGAYHGSYDYAEVSLSTGPDHWGSNDMPAVAHSRGTPQGVLDDVVVIPYHDALAGEQILHRHAGELAAVLFDPVASRVGMIPPRRDVVDMLVNFCESSGALLIFDEVVALRVGYGGAQGVLGVRPHLSALGKIIGGGFPVGAVAGCDQVMQVFEPGGGLPHGGTFNGNPITMVAGMATMQAFDESAIARLNAMGERLRQGVRQACARAGVVAQVTGQASLARLHLTTRALSGYRSVFPTPREADAMRALHRYLLNAGHYVSSYGMICLSTANTEDEVDALVNDIVSGLKSIAKAA